MKSRGVVFTEPGVVRIEEFELPAPGPRDVLVEANCTLISPGTERLWLGGGPMSYFPMRPGYSMAGTVIEVGSEVSALAAGDRVISGTPHGAHALAHEEQLVKIPERVSFQQAVFFNVAQTAQIGVRRAEIEAGDPVAILGQGLIGLLAARLARLQGACPLVTFDIAENRRKLSLEYAADICLDPRDEEAVAEAMAELDGRGPAAVIELTARPETLEFALRITRPQGRVVLVSAGTGGDVSAEGVATLFMKGLDLAGAFVGVRPWSMQAAAVHGPSEPPGLTTTEYVGPGMWSYRKDEEVFLRMLRYGVLDTAPLVTHHFDGTAAPAAFEMVKRADPSLIGAILHWA